MALLSIITAADILLPYDNKDTYFAAMVRRCSSKACKRVMKGAESSTHLSSPARCMGICSVTFIVFTSWAGLRAQLKKMK